MACLLEIVVPRAYDLCYQWANPKSILELREGQTGEWNGKGRNSNDVWGSET